MTQNLARTPLASLDFEPAVQAMSFHVLAPESMLYLRFSPRFCPEAPGSPVCLTIRSLDPVLSAVFAF
jgi:hypothetical protein